MQRADLDDPGIVDQNVDAAELTAGFINQIAHLWRVRDITGDGNRGGAALHQIRLGASQFGRIASTEHNATSFTRKRSRQGQSEAARAARDEYDLSPQIGLTQILPQLHAGDPQPKGQPQTEASRPMLYSHSLLPIVFAHGAALKAVRRF
jgi:hypothetical protein